jgi:hypothetical protein
MERLQYAKVTPTITSGSAYATGNAIGGLLTFPGIANRGFSAVYSVTIIDKSGQNPACDLILFSQTFTPTADKSAIAISAADSLNCLGNVKIATGDWSSMGTPGVALKTQLFFAAVGDVDNNIYGQLICRGTPTFTSTSDITIKIGAEIGIL